MPATPRMPVLFIGHGSPMNAIEDNEFSLRWKLLAKEIPQTSAVVCVSAHWLTKGTHITAIDFPQTIRDFGGFPQALFDVRYPAPGNATLAQETKDLIKKTTVGLDHEWVKLAVPTPDHYLPLIYTLALQENDESPSFFNDKAMAGSLNMTSVRIG